MARRLNIETIGVKNTPDLNSSCDVVLRVKNRYPMQGNYRQLVVCEDISGVGSKTDLLTIQDFSRIRNNLTKKIRPNLGLEISIADARRLNANALGRWLSQAKYVYRLCKSARCQFIISSGAQSIFGMVSSRTFESILTMLNISPANYWAELSAWLDSKDTVRSYEC